MKKSELNGQAGHNGGHNGQPSMEEILASIRKIIAEEPMGSTPFPEPRLTVGTNARAEPVDEAGEFDLPSILRPSSQPSPEKHTPLFGRLADALRGASSTPSEAKPAKPQLDETPVASKEVGAPAASSLSDTNLSQMSLSSLSSARVEAPSAPAPNPAAAHPADETRRAPDQGFVSPALRSGAMSAPRGAPSPSGSASGPALRSASGEDVKRVMVPFKDQRMSRMSGMEGSADSHHHVDAALPGHGADFGGFVPGEAHDHFNGAPVVAGDADTAAASASALGALAMGLAESGLTSAPNSAEPVPEVASVPPALPNGAADAPNAAGNGVKDAAAELLRPMLRQWLADNMPRIVEQALHIEVAESLKPPKK